MLDELDKVGADFRGDPAAALLEVLDPAQNNTFTDHYLDLPFDLSRVLFITTANWLEPVHPALRDRLEVIELPSYTESEKLADRQALPGAAPVGRARPDKQGSENPRRRPSAGDPRLHPRSRRAAIGAGNRGADAQGDAPHCQSNGHTGKPLVLKPESLTDYLGAPGLSLKRRKRSKNIGIATGLAWTPVGGEILFIEATRMPGKGSLLLTGSLGDVMKESAQTAVSYLRSQAKPLGIDLTDYAKFDMHIHVPAGATPKDGPSAGVTLLAALASLLTRRRVRSDVAMTGEISLRGRVMRVGGIKEKVLAAARFGIKQVILPDQNKTDWRKCPKKSARSWKSISSATSPSCCRWHFGQNETIAPGFGSVHSNRGIPDNCRHGAALPARHLVAGTSGQGRPCARRRNPRGTTSPKRDQYGRNDHSRRGKQTHANPNQIRSLHHPDQLVQPLPIR